MGRGYHIILLPCSFGWSVSASWHLCHYLVCKAELRGVGYVLVAGKDFGAATESEPAITLAVMPTSSSTGQFLASDDAQIVTDLFQMSLLERGDE